MNTTDQKIIDLQNKVKEKLEQLGSEPTQKYKTDAVVPNNLLPGYTTASNSLNIHSLNSAAIEQLIGALLISQKCDDMGRLYLQNLNIVVQKSPTETAKFTRQDYIDDLVIRYKKILYKERKKELDELNQKLESLLSAETKTKKQLDELENLLS